MKSQLMLACVFALSVAAFSEDPTAVQPAGDRASRALTFQSSGQTLRFQVRDVKQSVRIQILDMQGRPVWSRVVAPTDGTANVSWEGTGVSGSRVAGGVYAVQATTRSEKGEAVLMTQSFAYTR